MVFHRPARLILRADARRAAQRVLGATPPAASSSLIHRLITRFSMMRDITP